MITDYWVKYQGSNPIVSNYKIFHDKVSMQKWLYSQPKDFKVIEIKEVQYADDIEESLPQGRLHMTPAKEKAWERHEYSTDSYLLGLKLY